MIVLIDDPLLNREVRMPFDDGLYRRDDPYDQKWGAVDAGNVEPFDDGWEQPRLQRKAAS